jgi:hypothetical protein
MRSVCLASVSRESGFGSSRDIFEQVIYSFAYPLDYKSTTLDVWRLIYFVYSAGGCKEAFIEALASSTDYWNRRDCPSPPRFLLRQIIQSVESLSTPLEVTLDTLRTTVAIAGIYATVTLQPNFDHQSPHPHLILILLSNTPIDSSTTVSQGDAEIHNNLVVRLV